GEEQDQNNSEQGSPAGSHCSEVGLDQQSVSDTGSVTSFDFLNDQGDSIDMNAAQRSNSDGPNKTPPKSFTDNSVSTLPPASASQNRNGSGDATQLILQKLNQIMGTQKRHSEMLQKLMASQGLSIEAIPKPKGWPDKLPIPGESQFFTFELFLTKQSNFDFTVNYFANSTGHKDFAETTRDILKQLISQSLKQHLNWIGTDKKFGLKSRKTGDLLIAAVKMRHERVATKEITKVISTWLRNNISKKRNPAEPDGSESNSD
ncbi:Putative lipase ATG15, partial [Frankliniella fusca]